MWNRGSRLFLCKENKKKYSREYAIAQDKHKFLRTTCYSEVRESKEVMMFQEKQKGGL